MSAFRLLVEHAYHPGELAQVGVYSSLEAASTAARKGVGEWMAVLFEPGLKAADLLISYRDHGERPTVLEGIAVADGFDADAMIHASALAWAEGDAYQRWVPAVD